MNIVTFLTINSTLLDAEKMSPLQGYGTFSNIDLYTSRSAAAIHHRYNKIDILRKHHVTPGTNGARCI